MRFAVTVAVATTVAACANTSVLPISKDTYQITASVDSECGATGAQQIALRQAAVETIRKGYDKFLIVENEYSNNVRVVGYTPVVAKTTQTVKATAVEKQSTVKDRKHADDKHKPKHKHAQDRKSPEARQHTVHRSHEKVKAQTTTTYSGGQPIIDGTHDQELVVKMFKADDPAGADAVSARETLGPKWQDAVASKMTTCFDT